MSISKMSKRLKTGLGIALLCAAPAAHAQMKQDEPNAVDVARTPLEDFNIESKDIPEVLQKAVANPYDYNGMTNCNALVAEIAVLDNVLGPDFDVPQEESGGVSTGRVAKSVVGMLVPFRGLVREVSGANKRRNRQQLAIAAGMVRRAYLKGMGEARGCAYPARPRREEALDAAGVPNNLPRGEAQEPGQN